MATPQRLQSFTASQSHSPFDKSAFSSVQNGLQQQSRVAHRSSSRTRQVRSTDPGDTTTTARNLGVLSGNRTFRDSLSRSDRRDCYRFTVSNTQTLSISLRQLQSDADLQLLNSRGSIVAKSSNAGRKPESLQYTLEPGTYYLNVSRYSGNTNYTLNTRSRSFSQPTSNLADDGNGVADWTVMVYMASSNLESFALQDFQEMANVGSNSHVNIVVQMDRTAGYDSTLDNWTDTRRGLVTAGDIADRTWGTSIGEANMGSASTLTDFVNWGTANYQADHYAVVVWGHGSGFSIAPDDVTGDLLSASDISSALSNASQPIDLFGADACLMGMTEFAYEIRNQASVFVGSQEVEPGTSWDYTGFLTDLSIAPSMTAADLGTSIVNRYGQYYSSPKGNYPDIEETLSAINLSALRPESANTLTWALDRFADTVLNWSSTGDRLEIDWNRDRYSNQFNLQDGFSQSPDYLDVGNLFYDLTTDWSLSWDVRGAAQDVLNAYSTTVIANYTSIPGRTTGLSIYFSDKGQLPDSDYNGMNLSFAADTQWDDFLWSDLW